LRQEQRTTTRALPGCFGKVPLNSIYTLNHHTQHRDERFELAWSAGRIFVQ
jgi:hypothetical protein